jgi:hypothetical protein
MAVRWFLARIFTLTSPKGMVSHTTTFDRIDWEAWTYTDEDGVAHAVKFPAARYPFPKSFAYNETQPPYTVALVRAEVPDGIEPVAADRVRELTTAANWRTLATQYPALIARFTDQPTG